MIMKNRKIGTHNGAFHCDEVMACALLKMLPEYKDAEIVRTRDQGSLDQCDIVVDVGMVFDHDRKRYDHHQVDFHLTMKGLSKEVIMSDTPLSSAGLIFWFYGKEIIKKLGEEERKSGEQKASDELVNFIMQQLWDDDDQDTDKRPLIWKPMNSFRTLRVLVLAGEPNQNY